MAYRKKEPFPDFRLRVFHKYPVDIALIRKQLE